MGLELVTLVVRDYDEAIDFFVRALGFTLTEDVVTPTGDAQAKRWVVVRPPGAGAGLLLAQAIGADQAALIGRQTGDRVGFFLRVEDFAASVARMEAGGVQFFGAARSEPYGMVRVFRDVAGNRWDLLGPVPD